MTQTARIGIFLAGALLVLAVVIFIVGDLGRLFHEAGYPVYATFNSVAGLDKRATVRLSGVEIGTVSDIKLEGRRPIVEMDIDPWAKIPTGSRATLSTLGLLGEKYVEILPSEEPTFVPKGGTIGSLAAVSFDQIGLLIVSIGDELKGVSAKVQRFLGEENAVRFGDVLASLAETSRALNEFVKANRGGLDTGIQSATKAFEDLDRGVNRVAGDLSSSAQSLKDLLSENRPDIKDSLEKIKAVLDRMDEAARNLNSLLQRLEKGEGSLGRLISQPELYDQAKETIAEVRSAVRPLAGIRPLGEAQAAYYASSELWKGSLTLGLSLASGPFLMGQVVRDPFLDRFTYSLELGKRWGPIAPRVGVIESDFGVGFDYYALRDRLRLSLEGFDFNRASEPRLRLSSRFFPSRYVFLVLGLDDVISNKNREVFLGLGVGLR
jgi:phospholipid/cholesterol/gamma-HCH transport system substrate-binding protein